MSIIVMTSAPYCYGPTSKMLYIAEALFDEHTLIFVGSKPGVALARNSGFTDIIEIDDRDSWDTSSIEALEKADLLVSFLDYRSLKIAKKYSVPSIFFDTLYWLRTNIPPFVEKADVYVVQKFFQPPTINPIHSYNLVEVGPIIPKYIEAAVDDKCQHDDDFSILVNVGGLRSPVMEDQADIAYLSLIIQILKASGIVSQQLALCLPIYLNCLAKDINRELPEAKVLFLNAQEFHEHLLSASLLITQPGLEVVFEAMFSGIPIVLLPPHNATQVMQAKIYSQFNIHMLYLQFEAIKYLDGCKMSLDEMTSTIQQFNISKRFDKLTLEKLGHCLSKSIRMIQSDRDTVQRKCNRNKNLVLSLGDNGRDTTVDQIKRILASKSEVVLR